MLYIFEEEVNNLLTLAKSEELDIADGLLELSIPENEIIQSMLDEKENILASSSELITEFSITQKKINADFRNIKGTSFYRAFLIELLIFPILLTILYVINNNSKLYLWLQHYSLIFIIAYISSIFFTLIPIIRKKFFNFDTLNKILLKEKEQINLDILQKGIKPFLRLYINSHNKSKNETFLRNPNPGGLWSIMDNRFEVPSQVKEKIVRLISSLAGGSIGIAGPRGSGKSTILSGICFPKKDISIEEPPTLSILTSVPVKYDPKEFILLLFTQICEKVISLETQKFPNIARSQRKMARARATNGFNHLLSQNLGSIVIILYSGIFGILISISLTPTEISTFYNNPELISALIKADEVFKASIIMILISIFLLVRLFPTFFPRSFNKITNTSKTKNKDYNESKFYVELAEYNLENIKYQLSYSAGWSESVKLPESIQFIESMSEYSYSKTRNILTLPEIVNEYRAFIRMISNKYKIIIGIDELDKISSSIFAQQFLNETKSIFGIDGCYYIISVSDNALSNFERRGIALRDEFDTAFDDVLYLETPSIEYCLDLLRKRVIGFPIPFVYFCYVMSGGLPRDLLRTCRTLFDIASVECDSEQLTLRKITKKLILLDLCSKIRSISIATIDNPVEPETSFLLETITNTKTIAIDLENWHTNFQKLQTFQSSNYTIENSNYVNNTIKLIRELSAYLLFSSTVYQYFDKLGKSKSIRPLSKKQIDSLENLAHAKQMITTSPQFALSQINKFCNYHKISNEF